MTLVEFVVLAFSSRFVRIVAVALVTYTILAVSARGATRLSPSALRLTTRLMGLLLAAIAM